MTRTMETMTGDADSTRRLDALAFAERARKIATNPSPETTIQQIISLALEGVSCDFASVTVVHVDGPGSRR